MYVFNCVKCLSELLKYSYRFMLLICSQSLLAFCESWRGMSGMGVEWGWSGGGRGRGLGGGGEGDSRPKWKKIYYSRKYACVVFGKCRESWEITSWEVLIHSNLSSVLIWMSRLFWLLAWSHTPCTHASFHIFFWWWRGEVGGDEAYFGLKDSAYWLE